MNTKRGSDTRTEEMYNLGVEIRRLLDEKVITQTELCAKLDRQKSYVSGVCQGQRRIRPDMVDLFAEALELDESERHNLHILAAQAFGFDLGPIKLEIESADE